MTRTRRDCTTLAVLALVAWFAGRGFATGDAEQGELDLAEAVARVSSRAVARAEPSVVSLRAFGGREGEEFGAGVIVTPEGRVLTALHVVDGATTIGVRLSTGEQLAARFLGADPTTDLALLEIRAPGRTFPVARFGRDRDTRVGEPVFVVGNPFGLHGSVTSGILSARGRKNVVQDNLAPLLQTDAVINPGSSGGALVNVRGEVIGLVNAILTRTGGHQGLGFAVPASELRRALPFLLEGKPVVRAWLGIRVQTNAASVGDGVTIHKIVDAGPAAAAGLREGDTLVRLQGARVSDVEDVRAFLRGSDVGERIRAVVRRGRDTHAVTVTLGQLRP